MWNELVRRETLAIVDRGTVPHVLEFIVPVKEIELKISVTLPITELIGLLHLKPRDTTPGRQVYKRRAGNGI